MNQNRVMNHYRRLLEVSGCAADIFGSELCAELAGSGTAVLKMQLEQEHFFRLLDSGDTLDSLRERLEPYSGTERRGLLLYMLEALSGGLLRTDRLRMVRLPLPELESRTAGAVEYAARLICADISVPERAASCGKAPAAALAAAVFAEMPEDSPEEIGAVSAAAASAGRRDAPLRLTSTLLFLTLSPLRSGDTGRLLPLLALFLNGVSWLTGCPVSVPRALTLPAVPIILEETAGEAAELWDELPKEDAEPEIPRERA
ncbi:MAG: hypothetical protein K2O18_01385 [Oscillospiraceae bacterium]|nr:hypothetical protein [Oscillospiraceae bacterium]